MARGSPSMTALLGLLAVLGYQNRDKIAEILRNATKPSQGGQPQQPGQAGGLGDVLGQLGGAGGVGGILSGGLGELLDRFRENGQGDKADSWVQTGPNQPIEPKNLEQAIGPDVLDTLSQQTGLSREELLKRLSRELPEAVDKYTPQGRVPSAADFPRA
jgi:uncharacterized protein YidB (DUF937 family)